MTYETRTDAIGSWLRDVVLPRYNRPDHLGDNEARAEVADMVEDINRVAPLMGDEALGPFLADAFARVRMTYTGRSWPPIGVFCKAVGAAAKDRPMTGGRPAEHVPDDYAIMAAKMRAGQPVGQDYLYGPKAKEIEARGLIDAATLKTYRSSLFFSLRDTYGQDDAERTEARLIAEHAASVRPTSDAELAEARSRRFAIPVKRMAKVEA